MTTRLLLIRHGEPDDDGRGRCYGSLDYGLSDLGRRQSAALADRLAELPAGVVSSPRARAKETAAAFGRTVTVVEHLRELDFGELEGRRYEEIEREQPELYRRWMTEPASVRFPGGEGFDDLRLRASRAIADLLEHSPGETIAVITHGGVVRATLADALGLPSERIFRLDIGYCRVSVVDWFDATPVVRMVNGSGDLPDVRLAAG